MAENHLQNLFTQLNTNQQGYEQPSVSSPIFSPLARATPPVHSSDVLSPVQGTPAPDLHRTQSALLNLLKPTPQSAAPQSVGASSTSAESRPIAAFEFATPAQRNLSGQSSSPAPAASTSPEQQQPRSAASKDFLLGLFKTPRASSTSGQVSGARSPQLRGEDAEVDKLAQSFAETAVEAPQPTRAPTFNYMNPFDQLHPSSPLNRTPDVQGVQRKIEILKHNRDNSSSQNGETSGPALKSRKVESELALAAQPPSPAPDKTRSVSEALEGVGDKVDKQVERALAEAGAGQKDDAAAIDGNAASHDAAPKKGPTADDEVDSSWESAEDEEAGKEDGDYDVEVYNFPMKPFVSINIKNTPIARSIRQDNFTVIAQLKKDFDQVDRCLVTASQSHIIYAQVATKKDNGGFRIIRQDSGNHKQIFRSSGERVFNVQLCNSASMSDDVETVLGTGVDGSVFWTSVAKSRGDLFVDDDVEAQGFIFPAVATLEQQSSGSPIKTRAKMSSRHTEFFAVARGKQIYIITPDIVLSEKYCDPKTRRVNSEKYLSEHGLKIMTGKAGKDFCFSEDDSVIVSLDKSGRFKFWDIKDLTSHRYDNSPSDHRTVELRDPIWSLTAAASGSKADEKPSVSSIMLLDKERPTTKGVALRYMLIGFKQNHILQLWDLGLGKPVQEIRLPHEKDSDGICSITYHPRSGILAIAHPTRNSLYLIHLSAPRYNLAPMDQATYVTLLARNETASLPQPESTAIMSGLREFSFTKFGQLRSMEMLRQPFESASDPDSEDATLFELYVMHSKGVVVIGIKRQDLGWDKDSRMLKPLDAIKAGIAEVGDLSLPQTLISSGEQSSNADMTAKKQSPTKNLQQANPRTAKSEAKKVVQTPSASTSTTNGSSRVEDTTERSSKQPAEASSLSQQTPIKPLPTAPNSYAVAAQRAKSPEKEKALQSAANAAKKVVSSPQATPTTYATNVSSDADLRAMIAKQFDALYQRIDGDKRVQDAAGAAKQDAILRLVSSTLTENVEKSLNRIVSASIEKEVLPNVTKLLSKKVSDALPQQLGANLSREIKTALPGSLQQSLKDPQVLRTISDQVAVKVQQQVSALLQQSMPSIVMQATKKVVSDLEHRIFTHQYEFESRHRQDSAKIQELSEKIHVLSQTVKNVSESQEQILQSISAVAPEGTARGTASTALAATDPEAEAVDEEVKAITQMLTSGDCENATLGWLKSGRQAELFDRIFVRVNPQYLDHVSPLVALSVSAAITASFETHIGKRLEWLNMILSNTDLKDADIRDVAPNIMDVLSQRLLGAYMQVSEANPNDTVLRHISALNKQVNEVKRLSG